MKTVVYLDVLLLTNFLMAWFLLTAAGHIVGLHTGYGRLTAASAVAAAASLILFVPQMPEAAQFLYKLATGMAVFWAAYGARAFWRYLAGVCWYTALNLLVAGIALLSLLEARPAWLELSNLTVYLAVSPWLLVLCAGGCCLALELLLRFAGRPGKKIETAGLSLELCGSEVLVRAALDTGCHLQDPITCMPVLVVSFPDAKARLPAELNLFLSRWFSGEGPAAPPPGVRLRLIPCKTAVGDAMLPGVAVGDVRMISQKGGSLGLGRTAVAFTRQSFSSEEYEAIYGPDFL